jgi:hypothetical protein
MKLLRSLFGLFVIVAAIYCGWLVLPPYLANYRLEESVDDTARTGTMDRTKTEEDLRYLVEKDARSLGIDLSPEQIQVERSGGEVLVWTEYTVHIDMPLHPFDLHFQPMSNSKKRTM